MPLGDRIKALRKEKGWSQGELAEKVEADARQVSRYENGRVTPSAEALVKIARALDVSVDYLLVEDAPRRPLKVEDQALLTRLQEIKSLTDEDRASLLHIIDALLVKNKVRFLAQQLG